MGTRRGIDSESERHENSLGLSSPVVKSEVRKSPLGWTHGGLGLGDEIALVRAAVGWSAHIDFGYPGCQLRLAHRACRSQSARRKAVTSWLHTYDHDRPNTGLGGNTPISRVTQPAKTEHLQRPVQPLAL